MAREQKKKEIDGVTYLVTQMDAVKALRVQTKLIKLIGPGVSKIKSPTGTEFDVSSMLTMLEPLLEKVNDAELFEFIMSLFENGVMLQGKTKDGQLVPMPLNFEEHFVGKTMTMWKVVGFILEANFGLGKSLGLNLSTTGTAT